MVFTETEESRTLRLACKGCNATFTFHDGEVREKRYGPYPNYFYTGEISVFWCDGISALYTDIKDKDGFIVFDKSFRRVSEILKMDTEEFIPEWEYHS